MLCIFTHIHQVMRPGKDVTIVAFSRMVQFALEAAATLATEGIEAEVMNLRSIRPHGLVSVYVYVYVYVYV